MRKEYFKPKIKEDNTKTLRYLRAVCKTLNNNNFKNCDSIVRILKYEKKINGDD